MLERKSSLASFQERVDRVYFWYKDFRHSKLLSVSNPFSAVEVNAQPCKPQSPNYFPQLQSVQYGTTSSKISAGLRTRDRR